MKAVSAQAVSCCVYDNPQKIMQHLDGIISNMFDFWANPFVHLLVLKSSAVGVIPLETVGYKDTVTMHFCEE